MNGINLSNLAKLTEKMKATPSTGHTAFAATLEWKDSTRNDLLVRSFDPVTVDEPEEMGGTDKGANPGELLLAAVGGCFTITFELAIASAGIKLNALQTVVEGFVEMANVFGITSGAREMQGIKITLKVDADADFEKITEIAFNSAKSSPITSPTVFPSTRLIPTSMTVAPSFTMSAVT